MLICDHIRDYKVVFYVEKVLLHHATLIILAMLLQIPHMTYEPQILHDMDPLIMFTG